MKTLIFVRHAKSSWSNMQLADHDRPLNDRGKRDAPFMAKQLTERIGTVDAIISSSALRALTTAKTFAGAYAYDEDKIVITRDLYLTDPGTVKSIVQNFNPLLQSAAIFGHNPCTTSIANMIPSLSVDNVPTAGVLIVETEIEDWSSFDFSKCQFKEFLYPKLFV